MTKEEIKALINAKIKGQGSQVDLGGALPTIIEEVLDSIPDIPASASVFQLLGYPSTGDEIPYSQVAAESGITKQVIEDVVAGKYYAFRSPDGIHLIPLVYATASSEENNYHILFGHYFQIGSIESGDLWEVQIVGNVGYVHSEAL